jgi:hypothetical protein
VDALPCRVPDECPQEIADLLASCLLPEPADRPSAAQIVVALREDLGAARQAPLPLQMAVCRLERHSDYSFSMEKTAEQMSIRGAEAVQLRARRFGKSHTFNLSEEIPEQGPDRLRRIQSLPGTPSGEFPDPEVVCGMRSCPAVGADDATLVFDKAFDVYQNNGVMASPFEGQPRPSLF